jgi:hypothetical protein
MAARQRLWSQIVIAQSLSRPAALAAVVVLGSIQGCGEEPEPRLAPTVPRLVDSAQRDTRVVSTHQLLEWGSAATPMALIDTAQDAFPNGLALSMVPLFVDWQASRFEGTDPHVLVRNVNVGGNPIDGENLLATMDIPLDGLEAVEWCFTPDRNEKNEDTLMGHAMLRFIFAAEQRPVVLGEDGKPLERGAYRDDLMLSWEAWRPPRTRYEGRKGLDPRAYALTARLYGGAQRFLTDALRNNPWVCYPLDLPDVAHAEQEVLLTGLLMGDALARRVVHALVEEGTLEVKAEDLAGLSAERLDQVRATFSQASLPDVPLTHLMGKAKLSYDLLRRSCITVSLTTVQLALDRIYELNRLGSAPQMQIIPKDIPDWVGDLATADRLQMLAHLPGALLFVARNHHVIPGEAHGILDDAGLLRHENGKPLFYYYHIESMTPYGHFRDNMM